jgi:Protein of unknown function (DUF2695)
MLTSHGCDNKLRWAKRWQGLRASRATALEQRLASRRGYCDWPDLHERLDRLAGDHQHRSRDRGRDLAGSDAELHLRAAQIDAASRAVDRDLPPGGGW